MLAGIRRSAKTLSGSSGNLAGGGSAKAPALPLPAS
jgi:hypothetical protein